MEYLSHKLNVKIGFVYRSKSCFSCTSQKVVQFATMSVLDYGAAVYIHASSLTLKPLDTVFNSALRFITGDKFQRCDGPPYLIEESCTVCILSIRLYCKTTSGLI